MFVRSITMGMVIHFFCGGEQGRGCDGGIKGQRGYIRSIDRYPGGIRLSGEASRGGGCGGRLMEGRATSTRGVFGATFAMM